MSDIANSSEDLKNAVIRFDSSLTRLESSLAEAVSKIANLARTTGYADAKAEVALKETENSADKIRNDELEGQLLNAKQREQELEEAVKQARGALSEAIDDIRNVLGPI